MTHDHDHDHDHGHDDGHDHDHEHDHGHEHGHEHLDPVAHAELHLNEFREQKDQFMRDNHHSPLDSAGRNSFKGLAYYPFNPDMVMALPLDTDVQADPLVLPTSTGGEQTLRRQGKIHFEINGQPATLTVFRDEHGELFMPLRDATSGKDTYGAGRYLEPDMLEGDTIYVDFNYLYNPFCAYSEAWSCPLPPMENWLRVPIEAGEKTYNH